MLIRGLLERDDMRDHRAKVEGASRLQVHDGVNQANTIPAVTQGRVDIRNLRTNQADSVVVKFLAENGADLQAKDANGRTPLDLAKGVGVPGVRQAAREPFPETVAVIE